MTTSRAARRSVATRSRRLLACGQFSPLPTLAPLPASATARPGPETPTPRPEGLTQPAIQDTPATVPQAQYAKRNSQYARSEQRPA